MYIEPPLSLYYFFHCFSTIIIAIGLGVGTGCSHYCTDVSISGINVTVYLSEKKE